MSINNLSLNVENLKLTEKNVTRKLPIVFDQPMQWLALGFKDMAQAPLLSVLHGLILALHYEARFLRNPGAAERARQGFTTIVARHQA